MKTKIKKTILLFAITFSLFSCSKDDDSTPAPITYNEENPLQEFLTATGFVNIGTPTINELNYETGLEFTPLVKGKINTIIIKSPDTNSAMRVTIWDATTKTVLRTEIVNITTVNTNITKNISPLTLEKNKLYAITFSSNDYFLYRRPGNTDANYPVTSGNIRIERHLDSIQTEQTYPTNFPTNYYSGDLTFNFQQTE